MAVHGPSGHSPMPRRLSRVGRNAAPSTFPNRTKTVPPSSAGSSSVADEARGAARFAVHKACRRAGAFGAFGARSCGVLLLSLCSALVGCSWITGPQLMPTLGPEVVAQVRAACATTAYRNCERDALEYMRGFPPRTLFVICDLGPPNGSVSQLLRIEDADKTCSEGGTIPDTKVVAVILVP